MCLLYCRRLLFSWSKSKWAHLVHCEEIFDSELELLTPLWQAILGSHCLAIGHFARRWFKVLGDRSCCSTIGYAARQRFTLLGDGSRSSTVQHGGWTMSLTARCYSHLLEQAQDDVAQQIQGARGLAVGCTTPDTHGRPHGLRP